MMKLPNNLEVHEMKSVNIFGLILFVLLANLNAQTAEAGGTNVKIVPIQVLKVDSSVSSDGIELRWYVNNEAIPLELQVERSLDNVDYEYLDTVYGTVADSQTVRFVVYDFNLPKGFYFYRLKTIGEQEISRYSAPVLIKATEMPLSVLEQNNPNPFNPSTHIKFHLATRNKVSLRVYNILGQQIATLVNGVLEGGVYSVIWEGRDLLGQDVPGGVYFYQILIGKYAETRRMILVR
jgi:hypothetical protein